MVMIWTRMERSIGSKIIASNSILLMIKPRTQRLSVPEALWWIYPLRRVPMMTNWQRPWNTNYKILVPLMGDQIACPVCEKRETHLLFMSLHDLGRHLNEHHVNTPHSMGLC